MKAKTKPGKRWLPKKSMSVLTYYRLWRKIITCEKSRKVDRTLCVRFCVGIDRIEENNTRYPGFCLSYQPSHKAGGKRASWGRICLPDGLQRSKKSIPYNQITVHLEACQEGSSPRAIVDCFPLLKAANTMAQRFKHANTLSF